MKKSILGIVFLTLISSLLVNCVKENANNSDGITWEQSVTLSGGSYGTSGTGGGVSIGTWTVNGASITLTCPAGYATPVVGSLPTAGNITSAENQGTQTVNATFLGMSVTNGVTADLSSTIDINPGISAGILNSFDTNPGSMTSINCVRTEDQRYFVAA